MAKDKLQSFRKTTPSNPENNQITFYITFIIIIIIIIINVGVRVSLRAPQLILRALKLTTI
jgi:hypothetical protein